MNTEPWRILNTHYTLIHSWEFTAHSSGLPAVLNECVPERWVCGLAVDTRRCGTRERPTLASAGTLRCSRSQAAHPRRWEEAVEQERTAEGQDMTLRLPVLTSFLTGRSSSRGQARRRCPPRLPRSAERTAATPTWPPL